MSADGRLRILIVGSSGGHLTQLHQLRGWWGDHDRRWVTFRTPDAISLLADEDVVWAHNPTTRNVRNLGRNLLLARRVLAEQRPDVVISTGAGVAVPFFALAAARGIPTVYLEVYDRIELPTLTGRLCRPFADQFLVQWEEQKQLYPGARLVGPVL